MNHPILESTGIVAKVLHEELADPWYAETLRKRARSWAVVEAWHAEVGHPGRFDHCDQQPCHAVVMAVFAA